MTVGLKTVCRKGQGVLPYIADLARLRIKIFREYPYLMREVWTMKQNI